MLLHKGIEGRGLQEMMLLKLWVPSEKAADTVFSPLPCQVLKFLFSLHSHGARPREDALWAEERDLKRSPSF